LKPIKALAKQTLVYGMGSIIPRILNYFLVPFYTRVFPDPKEYGVIVEFYAYVTFLIIVLTLGLETTLFRFSNKEEYSKEKVYSNTLGIITLVNLLFLSLVVIFSGSISSFLGYPNNIEYVIIFAIILVCDAISSIPFARLRIQNKAVKFSVFKILNVFINILLNIVLVYLIPKYASSNILEVYNQIPKVGYVFISNLIASLFTLFLLFLDKLNRTISIDKQLVKKLLIYGLPLCLAGLAGTMNEMLDRILIKILIIDPDVSMYQLGIFGANAKLAVFMTLFIQMFRFAAEPFFFNKAKDKDSNEVFAKVSKYFILFGLIIFLFIIVYIDIFKHFLGHKYWEGLTVVPILLIANLLLGVYFNLSFWYKLTNKNMWGLYITLVGTVLTVVINMLFLADYGYIVCAYAHLLCYIFMVVISYYLGQKYYPIKYDVKGILYYSILTAVIYIFVLLNPIQNHVLQVIVNSVIFVGFILYIVKKENLVKEFK
jgi:O-antigen/teichoic acid export membrane protein